MLLSCDREYMLQALALARLGWGTTNPNPMVGAVIVRDGKVIGEGFHRKAGEAHAEINAINDALRSGNDTENSTIYVTLEPCSSYGRTPPCTEAIIAHKFSRVVIGALDPNPKHNGLAVEILRSHGIEVEYGVESGACARLNAPFFHWVTTGKPLVMLKMAMTLDGNIATSGGHSKWVTGSEARKRVQRLRRLSDAIIVGANTVRCDHPQLTVREPESWARQPMRYIAGTTFSEAEVKEYFPDGNAEVVDLSTSELWEKFLRDAGERKMTAVLLEGGGVFAGSALRAGVVDYVEFHIAPKLLCGAGRPVIGGEAPELMSMAKELCNMEVERCGDDIIVSGYLNGE
ncbi:MAG: bifunctional diaminohydroxyphosphoribosylaminopyrimidine deaminase/5-amino-6-(5-phosphoribosylamino)uracil reductase RibD [Lentisphaeria bacterium]|nr:bifunctional diaminohydroxyphosphoribosylaminopyrimidine deaminase/5-amino-6-(5-phosphoribosylamino)uracil reductase RibD [Lentisphaeria bacterium]